MTATPGARLAVRSPAKKSVAAGQAFGVGELTGSQHRRYKHTVISVRRDVFWVDAFFNGPDIAMWTWNSVKNMVMQ